MNKGDWWAIYWDFPWVFDKIFNHTSLKIIEISLSTSKTAVDQRGKSSNELTMNEKQQNASVKWANLVVEMEPPVRDCRGPCWSLCSSIYWWVTWKRQGAVKWTSCWWYLSIQGSQTGTSLRNCRQALWGWATGLQKVTGKSMHWFELPVYLQK